MLEASGPAHRWSSIWHHSPTNFSIILGGTCQPLCAALPRLGVSDSIRNVTLAPHRVGRLSKSPCRILEFEPKGIRRLLAVAQLSDRFNSVN